MVKVFDIIRSKLIAASCFEKSMEASRSSPGMAKLNPIAIAIAIGFGLCSIVFVVRRIIEVTTDLSHRGSWKVVILNDLNCVRAEAQRIKFANVGLCYFAITVVIPIADVGVIIIITITIRGSS